MNDQHYEEDGTSPLPGNGAEKPKKVKATLDDLARMLAEMNERGAAAEPKLTRGRMSLREKVEYVATHGQAEYLKHPMG